MRRRDFIHAVAVGTVGTALAPWRLLAEEPGGPGEGKGDGHTPPNILMIVSDDMRPWLGCYGERAGVRTLNLDRLAERSTLFTRAYVAAPACSPSRASTLTGLAPWTTRYYSNRTAYFRGVPALAQAVTVPQALWKSGYEAVSCGKVFHADSGPQSDIGRSWDRNLSLGGSGAPDGPAAHHLPLQAQYATWLQWGVSPARKEDCNDWKNAGRIAAELARKREKPFFLAYGTHAPHMKYYAPQEFHDMQTPLKDIALPDGVATDRDDLPPLPKAFKDPKTLHDLIAADPDLWRSAIRSYLACISFADACIGQVLDALDRGPNRDNTIIVFWSDSGEHLGEKRMWDKGGLWDEADRSCLMIADLRPRSRGQRCNRVVSLLDIAPTLYAMCGVTPPCVLPGHDLRPLLADPSAAWDHAAITGEGWIDYLGHAVRTEQWHYIRYRDDTEELYDAVKDPRELTNLASRPDLRPVMDKLAKHVPQLNSTKVY